MKMEMEEVISHHEYLMCLLLSSLADITPIESHELVKGKEFLCTLKLKRGGWTS